MLNAWMEVAKISIFGFAIGIVAGVFLAWDIDKERVRETFKTKWEPFIQEVMEKYEW